MADQEDGSDFISIDDNAVSDGSSDANTRPEDTMLENLVDNNHRYLFERGSCVVKRWWSSNEIDSFRPFASDVGEACIAAIPWEIRNGVNTITAKLHGRVDCDGPNTDPDLRLKLEFYSGTDNDGVTTTNVTTVGRQVITLGISFNGEDVTQTRGYLLVWIKSEADEVINTAQVDTQGVGTSGNDWLAELDTSTTLSANLDERTNFKSIGPDEQFVWDMEPDTNTPLLDRQGIQLNYADSRLRCLAMIKGAFEESTKLGVTTETAYPTDGAGGNDPSKSEYRNEYAVADMDLRLRIRQSDGTAWSNNTGVDVKKTFEERSLHRVRPQAHFDLMNTWYWGMFPQTGKNQPSNDFRWAFQEGTFSRADLSLVGPQPIQIEIDTSDLTFIRNFPIRVDLEFAGWSDGPDTTDVELRGDSASEVRFGVVCMGTSYWELPPV